MSLTKHGKAALLAAAVTNLPPQEIGDGLSYIVEVGNSIFARVSVTHMRKGVLHLVISFDGDRARVRGLYDTALKKISVADDETDWPTPQRRAADWLNSQLLRLPDGVTVRS